MRMPPHVYFILCAICVLFIPGYSTVNGSFVCPDGWILNNTKCFYFSTDTVTWGEANNACQAKDAQLAEIYDESTNTALIDEAETKNDSIFWIGLKDRNDDGVFTWNSGNALTYTNWIGTTGNKNCVHIYWNTSASGWSDYSCVSTSSYICERNAQEACFWIGLTNSSQESNSVIFTNWTDENTGNSQNNIYWIPSEYEWDTDKCEPRKFYICERNAQETNGCNVTNNCDSNAQCEMTDDSYTCTCNTGFSGDGTTCSDINECSGANNCSEHGTCENTVGSFTCTCNWGFSGDGRSCIPQIRYQCRPDDSIYLYSLPEDCYIFVMQVVEEGPDIQCAVSDFNSTTVIVSACSKDIPIIITYGAFSGVESHLIQGGRSLVVVKAVCREISDDGVIHSINNSYTSNLLIDEDVNINPNYQVTSSLSETLTMVGSPITWTIYFPEEYILQVTSCTAYPGTDDSSPHHVSLISTGGCPVITDLTSHFTINENGTATAIVYAFKFYEYDSVFLACDLKVCPADTSACITTCSSKKRSVQERVNRDPRSVFPARINNVLRLIDPYSYSSGSLKIIGSSTAEQLSLIIVLTMTGIFHAREN